VTSVDPEIVSRAIVVWTGWGELPWPNRDESRLVGRFSTELTAALMPRLRELEAEFYATDANHVVADLAEMGDRAAAQFRRSHPELSENAVRALKWCYTYDYK